MSRSQGRPHRRFIRNDGRFDAETIFGLSPNEQSVYSWWWYFYEMNNGMQASMVSLRQATGKKISVGEINKIMLELRRKKIIFGKRSDWGENGSIYIRVLKKRESKPKEEDFRIIPGHLKQLGMFEEKDSNIY